MEERIRCHSEAKHMEILRVHTDTPSPQPKTPFGCVIETILKYLWNAQKETEHAQMNVWIRCLPEAKHIVILWVHPDRKSPQPPPYPEAMQILEPADFVYTQEPCSIGLQKVGQCIADERLPYSFAMISCRHQKQYEKQYEFHLWKLLEPYM